MCLFGLSIGSFEVIVIPVMTFFVACSVLKDIGRPKSCFIIRTF